MNVTHIRCELLMLKSRHGFSVGHPICKQRTPSNHPTREEEKTSKSSFSKSQKTLFTAVKCKSCTGVTAAWKRMTFGQFTEAWNEMLRISGRHWKMSRKAPVWHVLCRRRCTTKANRKRKQTCPNVTIRDISPSSVSSWIFCNGCFFFLPSLTNPSCVCRGWLCDEQVKGIRYNDHCRQWYFDQFGVQYSITVPASPIHATKPGTLFSFYITN